jgi:hypothetical protein
MKRIIFIIILVTIVENIFGQNLDFRHYGDAIYPLPIPIPKCPNCSFVFIDELFVEEDIDKLNEELIKDNIFEKEPGMPNYYYLAREAEIVGRSLDDISWWLLCSVWENEDESKKNQLIYVTIEYINKLQETDEMYYDYQIIKLDLLRRSGQFNEALSLIEEIKNNVDIMVFYNDIIVTIINRQIELIENNDQEEHPIPKNN